MARAHLGVGVLERVEAILRNPAIYELASLIPHPTRDKGGRNRTYPDFMLFVYEALLSVYRSARQVEAELRHPLVWEFMSRIVQEIFPDDRTMWLPETPMRRHHYMYGRNCYLANPQILTRLQDLHRRVAADQARSIGLLDPDGPGSWTHPHLTRMLYADGKVITPLFKGKAGDTRVDKKTGEISQVRFEPDAGIHFEGDGEAAFGTKFVMVAVRSGDKRGRMILDLDSVPKPGAEAAVAMNCFARLAPLVPGAQGVIYDTALRGIHHQKLLREQGLIPVNRVAAAEAGSDKPRRGDGRRVEKSVHVEDKSVKLADGSTVTVRLYARGGALGIGELTDRGEIHFVELKRIRTHRIPDKSGLYRWYNDYRLPESHGGGIVTVRLHATDEDAARKFNRTENVRVIPPTDPDFKTIYARRNDAESINRGLDDTLWLARAHSVGHTRQTVNLLGYALMVNGLTLLEHRRRQERLPSAAAA
ncbi:MAG: hypothetical protein WDA71_08165 [Actinomycetota bacterium]